MDTCRYCQRIRDEWDCHGDECRRAIAKALRRQRAGLPMVADRIRNELPSGAPTQQVIAVLSRQRLRARRPSRSITKRTSIIRESLINRRPREAVGDADAELPDAEVKRQTADGRTYDGRLDPSGELPRIDTGNKPDEYTVYWGDEAIEKQYES